MRTSRPVCVAALLAMVCLTSERSAIAQADTVTALTTLVRTAQDPSLRSAVRVPLPVLNFTASNTDKEVKGQAGFNLGASLLGNLTVTAPVDADENGRTTIADRNGLSHTAHVSGGLFFYRWNPRSDTIRINQICEAQRRAFLQSGDSAKQAQATQPIFCSTVGPLPDSAKRQIRGAVRWSVPITLALNTGWGRKSFQWTDVNTLQAGKSERTNWNIQAAAGSFVPPIGFISVEYTRQELFESAPSVQLCVPVGSPGVQTCRQTSTAAPSRRSDNLITGELRHFFGRELAAAVALTRNLSQDVTSVEVPLYFLPDATSGRLNGGIAANWSTDDRGVRMSVFIGTVFRPQIRGLPTP